MGPNVESWLQDCLHRVQKTLPTHRKSSYRENKTLQHHRCCTQATSQAMECIHNVWQSWGGEGKIYKSSGKYSHYSFKYNLDNITYTKNLLVIKTTLFQFGLHRDPSGQGHTML